MLLLALLMQSAGQMALEVTLEGEWRAVHPADERGCRLTLKFDLDSEHTEQRTSDRRLYRRTSQAHDDLRRMATEEELVVQIVNHDMFQNVEEHKATGARLRTKPRKQWRFEALFADGSKKWLSWAEANQQAAVELTRDDQDGH